MAELNEGTRGRQGKYKVINGGIPDKFGPITGVWL